MFSSITYPLMSKLEKRWTSRQIVVRMALMAVTYMYLCECNIYYQKNEVTYEEKINIIKLWSQQMEYSAENTNYCLTIL